MTPTPRLVLLVSALLGGCGASSGAAIGDGCSLESGCEDGAVCDFTDPGGPVCIDADGDLDGDGIPNTQDFCNHLAGGRFDEDLDGIGDDCDPCPIAKPPATPDSDDDGVDSPCDPEPSENGEEIVVFEGFNEGKPATVTATAGWTFVGGEAIATPADPSIAETMLAQLPLVSPHVAVLAQYRVDSIQPQATAPFTGVSAIDQRPAGGSQVRCGGTHTAGGAADRLLLDADAGVSSKDFMTSLFDPASLYRLAMQVDNAAAACAIVADNEVGATETTSTGEVSTHGGLRVVGAVARYQYLLIVQKNPAVPPR